MVTVSHQSYQNVPTRGAGWEASCQLCVNGSSITCPMRLFEALVFCGCGTTDRDGPVRLFEALVFCWCGTTGCFSGSRLP